MFAGRRFRSIFPLGVSGSESRITTTDGTIGPGRTSADVSTKLAARRWLTGVRRDEGDEHRFGVAPGHHHGLRHCGVSIEYRFDLAELDPVTSDLHLAVSAPAELDDSCRVHPDDISCRIQPARTLPDRQIVRR